MKYPAMKKLGKDGLIEPSGCMHVYGINPDLAQGLDNARRLAKAISDYVESEKKLPGTIHFYGSCDVEGDEKKAIVRLGGFALERLED